MWGHGVGGISMELKRKGKGKKQKEYEEFESLCQRLEKKNYLKEDRTFSLKDTNSLDMLLSLPLIVLVVTGYFWRWGKEAIPLWESDFKLVIFLLVVSIPVHELLHGLAWANYAKKKMKSISFGFNLIELMPYCHCCEALEVKAYKLGVLAPAVVLGGGYFLLALLVPNTEFLLLSAFNIFMATADLLIFWKAHGIHKGLLIDHPEQPGFVVFTKK